MKISKIKIEKLFGYYSYTIDLSQDITIIHGLNGCGKTTVLKMIQAIFRKDTTYIKSVDFNSICFDFDNKSSLCVYKKEYSFSLETNDKTQSFSYLAYSIKIENKYHEFDYFEKSDEIVSTIENNLNRQRVLPFLEKVDDDYWFDKRLDIKLSSSEMISKYGSSILKRYSHYEDFIPDEVIKIIDQVDVRLIATDRLTQQKKIERSYGQNEVKIEQKVAVIAEDISNRIKETIQKYALLSQSLDRTFPLRVIKATDPLPIDEIKNKIFELEKKRKQFVDTGILEEENEMDIHELVDSIAEDNRRTLSLYAIDTEKKLKALSDLSESINLFRTLVENNFINKKIVFNKDFGFRFVTTYSKTTISPDKLSSGEQHELVMFHDLIFNTTHNTLVLIDEPELSLHVKWQLEYIDDLSKIISVSGLYALLATHSPQIINGNWDITVRLSNEVQ